MKRFVYCALFFATSLIICSCATSSHVAPRFVQPSTAPIAKATKAAVTHVQKAREIASSLKLELPTEQAKVDALLKELTDAQSALEQSEGARAALDTQLQATTAQANLLAADYDKAGAQIASLKESRHDWVRRCWILGGLLAAAGVWILRKPLLAAAGGFL